MEGDENYLNLWHSEEFQAIANLTVDELHDVVTHRKDVNKEVQFAFRDLNRFNRGHYADFIKSCGRNIFPLIIATDHDQFGHSGVGTTFTLYLEDGSEQKIVPALHSNYEIYKCISHTFLGIMAILSPHFKNPASHVWRGPLSDLQEKLEGALSAVKNSTNPTLKKELLQRLLDNCLAYISKCFEEESFTFEGYVQFNKDNLWNLKECFIEATKIQAEKNIEALLKWKAMLGPELWRKVYVIIPTVFPVATNNPRIELFRNLLDEDKIHTNIIASEYPRNPEECRTLLGRVVGDRGLARFVFGFETHEAALKTVALSTGIDAVSDDAIPNIHATLRKHGLEPRPYKSPNPNNGGKCPMSS